MGSEEMGSGILRSPYVLPSRGRRSFRCGRTRLLLQLVHGRAMGGKPPVLPKQRKRIGKVARQKVMTLADLDLLDIQEKMVIRLVETLNEFDNLYFEIINEPYTDFDGDSWKTSRPR